MKSSPLAGWIGGCGLVSVLACGVADARGAEPLIPRAVLFGNAERANVQISPDGTRLSYLTPHQGVMNIWVQTIGRDDAMPITNSTDHPLSTYQWMENGEQILFLKDAGGNENHQLFVVELADGTTTNLTPQDGVAARIIKMDADFPDEVLIGLNARDARHHDVWRFNTRLKSGKMVEENPGYSGYVADARLRVRLATRLMPDGGQRIFMRDGDESAWYELVSYSMEDAMASGPIGFSRDGESLYLRDSRGSGTAALLAYRMEGEARLERIAHDVGADAGAVASDPKTGEPQAVNIEHARQSWTILDSAVKADFEFLRKEAAGGDFSIDSRDREDRRWVVSIVRDDAPTSYVLYDREKRRVTKLFSSRPAMQGMKLATMKPVSIRSRDGLELVSYLTTPVGVKAKKLPMVLLVHGGPWSRDRWGFNATHQWLANRGYAVLSVNFRGSTGFGKRLLNAGNREWAGRMHDDLIDAVNWAVSEGIAHPDKVAIMGTSYGGYATLVGLTFTPEYFAAGVSVVGPSHVRTLLESIPPYWEPIKAMFEARVGSLSDSAYLEGISPLSRVERIKRPLLIGQGRNDPRVKESESAQIVEAMESRGLPVTYVVFPDEGHGFRRPENRMAFNAVTEAFLAQHLGGRFEPIGDAVAASTAEVPAGGELIPGMR